MKFGDLTSGKIFRSQEELAREAIKLALKALRKRHLLEEGAHAPACIALSRPIISQVPVSLSQLILSNCVCVLEKNKSFNYNLFC